MKYRIVESDNGHWVDEMQRNVSREEFLLMLKETDDEVFDLII